MRAIFSRRGNLRPALLLVLVIGFMFAAQVTPIFAATIQVTTSVDEDLTAGGGGTGCSLREAIIAANTNSNYRQCTGVGTYGTDTITFAAGTNGNPITLTLGSALPAITGSTTITGNGVGVTIIRAAATPLGAAYGIFSVAPTSAAANFNTMTIRNGGNGIAPTNGACLDYTTSAGGNVTEVQFENCHASTNGGAIYGGNNAGVFINLSEFANNSAASGGAIYADSGSNFSVTGDSFLHDNTATGGTGGAIYAAAFSNLFGNLIAIINNNATAGSAVYSAANVNFVRCTNCCIVANDQYAVRNDSTTVVGNFTSTWWGVEYGPGPDPQPTVNGDTIFGTTSVDWSGFLEEKPAGLTTAECWGCEATSGTGGARTCSATISGQDPTPP